MQRSSHKCRPYKDSHISDLYKLCQKNILNWPRIQVDNQEDYQRNLVNKSTQPDHLFRDIDYLVHKAKANKDLHIRQQL